MRRLALVALIAVCASVQIATGEEPHETRANYDDAIRLTRAGEIGAARARIDAVVQVAPDWSEARFVRAGILTKWARAFFRPNEPVRRGVDYAGAEHAFTQARQDLARYLELKPWTENHRQVDEARRQLGELAASAGLAARTIASWDAHEYPIRGWVNCRADAYRAFWFEVDGKTVRSVKAGTHRIVLRTADCGTEYRDVTMPLYSGGPEQYVELSFVRDAPGPAQKRVDATLAAAIEVIHATELALLREMAGSITGARFTGGTTLVGGNLRLTGRDRGGWRWRAALQAQLGIYRGQGEVSSFMPAPGEPSVSGDIGIDLVRTGLGVRVHRAWHGLRVFGSVGLALDRWRLETSGVEPVTMLRAPVAMGIEHMRRCRWQYGARVQYSPTVPIDTPNDVATLEVSAALSHAWCGNGQGVTAAGIKRFATTGPAAGRPFLVFGIGVDRITTDESFGMRRELTTGEPFGAVFEGSASVTGPTLSMRTFEFGKTVRAAVEIQAGYYAGQARMTQYTPKPGSDDPGVGGLPRDVGVHTFQFGPALLVRLPVKWLSPFVAAGATTETWNSSDGENGPVTAFRLPLTAGIELVPACSVRFRLHARYSPGAVLGVQENFTTTQIGAALSYARCPRSR